MEDQMKRREKVSGKRAWIDSVPNEDDMLECGSQDSAASMDKDNHATSSSFLHGLLMRCRLRFHRRWWLHLPLFVLLAVFFLRAVVDPMVSLHNELLDPKGSATKRKQALGISDFRFQTLPPSPEEISEFNSRLTGDLRDASKILLWASKQFSDPGQLVSMTSFGPSGLVILHKLHILNLLKDVPVATIDTLHLFPETESFNNALLDSPPFFDGEKRELNVSTFRPLGYTDREAFDKKYGADLWRTDPEKYAYLTKVQPMLQTMEEMKPSAWITGRRNSQGGERSKLQVLELDNVDQNSVKLNPLASWSEKDVWDYIHKRHIPYNPLHDKGYRSIGDEMNTIPVALDAEERSGRFVDPSSNNKNQSPKTTECGLHSHLEKIKKMREEAKKENRKFDKPKLPCEACIDLTDDASFEEAILHGSTPFILVEFYSPMCGACQQFAPEFNSIANKLALLPDQIKVARFDITEHDVPSSGKKAGFIVDYTPTLYLVIRKPDFQLKLYGTGHHKERPILSWIEKNTKLMFH